MGLLDKKERVLDIVLTQRGRELLSKNQLIVKHYAFSDEGVNYSGSLYSSVNVSGTTFDDDVYRGLSFEATSKFQTTPPGPGGTSITNPIFQTNVGSLSSYLYTVPEGSNTLPDFKIGANVSASIELERRFYIEVITTEMKPKVRTGTIIDTIIRAQVAKTDAAERKKNYVDEQRIDDLFKLIDISRKL